MTAAPPPQSSYNATGTLRYVLTGARHDGLDGPRNWYVDGGGCMPETAEQQWRRVRVEHGKNGSSMVTDERGTRYVGDNVQALHLILSADDSEPGGVAGVHRRNKQIADRLAEGGWQYVIGTQDDGLGGKRHSHVVFNTVHPKTGRSMSGRHPAKDINQLRKIVDEVLAEHGIDNKALHADRQQVRYSAKERAQQADGAYVWKDDLDSRLGAALAASIDRDCEAQTGHQTALTSTRTGLPAFCAASKAVRSKGTRVAAWLATGAMAAMAATASIRLATKLRPAAGTTRPPLTCE